MNDEVSAESLYETAVADMRRASPDIAAIVTKLRRSIAGGSPHAAYALATWLLYGKDDVVAVNLDEAIKLLQLAAEAHHPAALCDLAVCYFNGEGVPKNRERAFELYLQAALHGDDQSVFRVGRAYFYGDGVPEDRRVAEIWLDRAEELGIFESEVDDVER